MPNASNDDQTNNRDATRSRSSSGNKALLIRHKRIPLRIAEYPHWLVWRYEAPLKGGDKPRKVPYYVNGRRRKGVLGSDKDVAQLCDFDTALQAARTQQFDGVGLAILPQQDITVLDLDNCIDDDGVYSDFANELIASGSYVERSPSGRGLRAVFDGALLHDGKRNFHIDNGERVEVYCGKAYTTFTGNRVSNDTSSAVLALPSRLKRRLVRGMEASGQSVDAESDDSANLQDSGLMSMDAAPLPNMTPGQALRVLQGLPDRWGAEGEGTWYRVAAAVHMQFDGSEEGWEVLDEWSRGRSGYNQEANRRRWDIGFSHMRGKQVVTSMRNLVFEARDAGVKFKEATLRKWGLLREADKKAAEDDIELPDDEASEEVRRAWQPVDISQWGTPERPPGSPALVRNWLYEGTVALFSSHGGGGKSYVSLTFAALAASGGKWFDKDMTQGKVLYLNGEDHLNDVHHRLWGICAAYGIDIGGLSGQLDIVDVTPLSDKSLYTASATDYSKREFTKQFKLLTRMVEAGGYKYVILDNLSKFYMANENSRPMVDEFVSALAALAMRHRLGVLLIGHASKLGADNYSGSTAWHNSARARWSLTVKDGVRTLLVEKNNYGETNHGGTLEWDAEFGVPRLGQPVGAGTAAEQFNDYGLLESLRDTVVELYAEGTSTSVNRRGPLGAIENSPFVLDRGLSQKQLRELLHQCVEEGLLGTEEFRHSRAGRVIIRYCPTEQNLLD